MIQALEKQLYIMLKNVSQAYRGLEDQSNGHRWWCFFLIFIYFFMWGLLRFQFYWRLIKGFGYVTNTKFLKLDDSAWNFSTALLYSTAPCLPSRTIPAIHSGGRCFRVSNRSNWSTSVSPCCQISMIDSHCLTFVNH